MPNCMTVMAPFKGNDSFYLCNGIKYYLKWIIAENTVVEVFLYISNEHSELTLPVKAPSTSLFLAGANFLPRTCAFRIWPHDVNQLLCHAFKIWAVTSLELRVSIFNLLGGLEQATRSVQ